jgi:outer membrane protein OmpA-like peptidoglycan-associated protein
MSLYRVLKSRSFLALLAIAMFASALLGQERPPSRFDIFTGYSWLHPGYDTYVPNAQENIDKGYTVSGTYFFNRNFGMGIDYGNARGCCCPQIYTLTAGPTVRFPVGRVTPFLHGLAGLHRMDLPSPFGNDTNWGVIAGGGLDVRIANHVSLRLVQADYEYAQHSYGLLQPNVSGVRLSTGLVWQFGEVGAPPVFPAVATCSVQPTAVFAGEPVTATAIGSGFNPKRTIVYSWSGDGVKVSGSSASTQIDTAGLAPGSYQVIANLNDGSRGGVASCNARFVVRQPNPPIISCSADPASVPTGGTSTISSIASSSDGRSLTYSYATSAGSITGNTSTATLDSTGAQPGTITVTCNVADDRNPPLTASATTTVDVQSPPPTQPDLAPLAKKLALHSIYFATAKPTREHPDDGLLPSQEKTLVTLAGDFQTYLQSKPDARLTLEGHTDPRASVEYNQALSERRVERTKRFLVEHGVPEAAIRTKAYGKEQNLSDAQIRAAVERNPELSTEARQRLLDNMSIIILASNRRVDITLSDAGQLSQESVREYPFNAADSLSLLDTHETGKPVNPTAKKKVLTKTQK